MKFKYMLLLMIILFVGGCVGSRNYKPLEWEKPLFTKSNKAVFPGDLIERPNDYQGQLIHLVGIIKDYKLTDGNPRILELTLDQKYYDYIEDNSVQTETIFLSAAGEGLFRLTMESNSALNYKEHSGQLAEMASRGDLAFVYGQLKGFEDGMPLLDGVGLRTFHEKYYTTKIMSYGIKRGELGLVEIDDDGMPMLTNVKLLKVAKPGEND